MTRIDLDKLSLFFLVMAFWMLSHSYYGIWHDGMLYSAQALSHVYIENFNHDLFFKYGSQDGFTLFTYFYAALLHVFTVDIASLLIIIMCQFCFLLASYWIIQKFAQGWKLYVILTFVISSQGYYGAQHVFSYAESFVTARTMAEPLCLLAIAACLSDRVYVAIALAVMSFLVHPIIGLAAMCFTYFYFIGLRYRLITILLMGLASVILLSHLQLFHVINARMDELWYSLSVGRAPYIFVDHWSKADWLEVFNLMVVPLLVPVMINNKKLIKISVITFIAGCIGLFYGYIGAIAHHALLIEVQTWRLLWIVKYFGLIFLASSVLESWSRSKFDKIISCWIIIGWLLQNNWGEAIYFIIIPLVYIHRSYGDEVCITRSIVVLTSAALAFAAVLYALNLRIDILTSYYYKRLMGVEAIDESRYYWDIKNTATLLISVLASVCFPVLMWGIHKFIHRSVLPLYALVFFLLGLIFFDMRSPEEKAAYRVGAELKSKMDKIVPKDSEGLWLGSSGEMKTPWLIAHRSNYFSFAQTAGIMFSRRTAIEAERRSERLVHAGLSTACLKWRSCQTLDDPMDKGGLQRICAIPGLDYIVVPYQIEGANYLEHFDHLPFMGSEDTYFYSCR